MEWAMPVTVSLNEEAIAAAVRPTAERLREAFQGLTLTIIREGRRRRSHLTPRSRVHRRILALLGLPLDTYTRLCPDSLKPP